MAQIIQIKRTQETVGSKTLHQGELAYSKADDTLYIGNQIGTDTAHTPVPIGGKVFTDMLTPSVTTGANATSASIVLGDKQADQSTVTLSAPSDVGTSYTLTLPSDVGSADEVLSTDASGNLTWATVTSSVEGATDTLVSGASSGQLLVHQAKMDTKTIGDGVAENTILKADAIAGGYVVTDTGAPVDENTPADTDVELGPGWVNTTLSGEVTLAAGGGTTITTEGKEAVKDFIESGDLSIQGTVTSINSTAVAISDKTLALGIPGGMVEGTVDASGGTATVSGLTGFAVAVDDEVYIEKTGDIPAGIYTVATVVGDTGFTFATEATVAAGTAIALSGAAVTDALADGGGLVIPGGTGLKTLTFEQGASGTDIPVDAFVSNQSLSINQDDPDVDETVNSLLTIEGIEFGKVTKANAGGTETTTATLGSTGIGWGGDIIPRSKGGTGLDLGAIAKGNLLYGSTEDVGGNDVPVMGQLLKPTKYAYNEASDGNGVFDPDYVDENDANITYIAGNPTHAVLTMDHDGVPSWSSHIDGGEF